MPEKEKSKNLIRDILEEKRKQQEEEQKFSMMVAKLQSAASKERPAKQQEITSPVFEEMQGLLEDISDKSSDLSTMKDNLKKLDNLEKVIGLLKKQKELTHDSFLELKKQVAESKKYGKQLFKERGGAVRGGRIALKDEGIAGKVKGKAKSMFSLKNLPLALGTAWSAATGGGGGIAFGKILSDKIDDLQEKRKAKVAEQRNFLEKVIDRRQEDKPQILDDRAEPLLEESVQEQKQSNTNLTGMESSLGIIKDNTEQTNFHLDKINKELHAFNALNSIVNDEEAVADRDRHLAKLAEAASDAKDRPGIAPSGEDGKGGGLLRNIFRKKGVNKAAGGLASSMVLWGKKVLATVGPFAVVAAAAGTLGIIISNLSKKISALEDKQMAQFKGDEVSRVQESVERAKYSMMKKDVGLTRMGEQSIKQEIYAEDLATHKKRIADLKKAGEGRFWSQEYKQARALEKAGVKQRSAEDLQREVTRRIKGGKGVAGQYQKVFRETEKERTTAVRGMRKEIFAEVAAGKTTGVEIRKSAQQKQKAYEARKKSAAKKSQDQAKAVIKTSPPPEVEAEILPKSKQHPHIMADAKAAELGLVKSSGYRSPVYNAMVGGSKRSYHLLGQAGDYQGGSAELDAFTKWAGSTGKFAEIKHYRGRHFAHLSWKDKALPGTIPSGARKSLMATSGVISVGSGEPGERLKPKIGGGPTPTTAIASGPSSLKVAKDKQIKAATTQEQIRDQAAAQTQMVASNNPIIMSSHVQENVIHTDRRVDIDDVQVLIESKNNIGHLS